MSGSERYEVVRYSDVHHDGMVLELWDRWADRLALSAFYSDRDGSLAFTSHRQDVPPEVESWFRQEAHRRLPLDPAFMTATVQLFARARELTGTDSLVVHLSAGATVADLRRTLGEQFPQLAELLAVSAVAVNHDFADDARVLSRFDEVAVIPPVSGG